VLFNLVDNAVRFTPPGGEIRVNARPDGERVQVSVTDTGVGIQPEHLPASSNASIASIPLGHGTTEGPGSVLRSLGPSSRRTGSDRGEERPGPRQRVHVRSAGGGSRVAADDRRVR
jgi:hypothetical protein